MRAPSKTAATRKRGHAGQKRRVALDKVEKVLRGDAKRRCIRLILRNLDAKDRGPIHPAKGLEIAAVIENRYVLGNTKFSGFAIASFTIFCANSEEMVYFFTTLAIGLPFF